MDANADTGCGPCATDNPCEVARCEAGSCVIDVFPDESECPSGVCHAGVCCTGCWDGSSCRDGTSSATCGAGGAECTCCACPMPACSSGSCTPNAAFRSASFSLRSACYVTGDGDGYCAGGNFDGQLGVGETGDEPVVALVAVQGGHRWDHISAGHNHNCGVDMDGALFFWGQSFGGQLASAPCPVR